MAEQKLVAEPRTDSGKGVARKLRAAGRVPAVLYGAGVESTPLSVDSKELFHLLHTGAGSNVPRDLAAALGGSGGTRGRRDRGTVCPAPPRRGCIVSPAMKVVLRNQGREVELQGRRRVRELLAELGILPESVLVIRGRDLLTIDEVVAEDDVVELRPVISGGRS